MSDLEDRTAAIVAVTDRACTNDFPELEPSEVEGIVDRNQVAQRWVAEDVVFTSGRKILPLTPNGRIYSVTQGGVLGTTEPFNSVTFPDTITDGTAILTDAGYALSSVYAVDECVKLAWEMKAAKAARLMASGRNMNMTKVFENCMRMVELNQTALVA